MRIAFERMNFEVECMYDLIHGRGFLINDKPYSDVDKTIRPVGGPRSPLYGTTFSDDQAFMDRYKCQCGKFIGAMFEGEICPECHTEVKFRDVDIGYTGWLNFAPFKIISPIFFHHLQSALSKKVLDNIIGAENIISPTGQIREYDSEIIVKKKIEKYYNIGLRAFYEHFEEIMLYYKERRKVKASVFDMLLRERDKVWTSKIPVYSTTLRPQSTTAESYYFTSIDREIHPLTAISLNIKNATDIEVPMYLASAQTRANTLWDLVFSLIDGKHGSDTVFIQ